MPAAAWHVCLPGENGSRRPMAKMTRLKEDKARYAVPARPAAIGLERWPQRANRRPAGAQPMPMTSANTRGIGRAHAGRQATTSNFAIGVQPLLVCRKHKIHQPRRLDRNIFRGVERTAVYGSP